MGMRPCDRLGEMVEARLGAYEMVELVDDCGEVMEDASVLASD